MKIRKIIAPVVIAAMAFSVTACAPDSEQSGHNPAFQEQSAAGAPEIDRSGEGVFPEVKGGFGEKPEIAAGTGDQPTDKIRVKTLVAGDGKVVGEDDHVLVNYAGVLWNGTPFDSSFEHGQPAGFSLNGVISGWKYGLASQKVGDRVELVIPAQWAYGEQGSGHIPANSTLVFVVDILGAMDTNDIEALKGAKETGNALPEGVTYEGKLGEEPKVTFGEGAAPTEEKFIVIAEGAGEKIGDQDQVVVRTVAAFQGGDYQPPSTWDAPQVVPAGSVNLSGFTVGSRLALLRPAVKDQHPAVVVIVDVASVLKADK